MLIPIRVDILKSNCMKCIGILDVGGNENKVVSKQNTIILT